MTTPTTYSASRLYIGNLAVTVDEYTLIQLCSKYGKISRMDYLFHKTGPSKGKPRGYAFVEFETKQEALRATTALHEKLIRGRKIVVTPAAEQTSYPEAQGSNMGGSSRTNNRGGGSMGGNRTQDVRRPTAISLLKGQGVAGVSTDRKIAALEAKLLALRKGKEPATESSTSTIASLSSQIQGGGDGEKWLDSLAGLEGINSSLGGVGLIGSSVEIQQGHKKTIIDAVKAGLPTRPAFDSAPPTPTTNESQ